MRLDQILSLMRAAKSKYLNTGVHIKIDVEVKIFNSNGSYFELEKRLISIDQSRQM